MAINLFPKRGPSAHDELVVAACQGSAEALTTLLETARTYLLLTGMRRLPRDLQVKVAPSDLVQQTLAEAHRSLATFDGHTHRQFAAWLLGILRHKLLHARRNYHAQCRDLRREELGPNRSSLRRVIEQLIDDETPSLAAMRVENAATLRQALARLRKHYQEVIHLRNFELLSFEEIGQRIGCSAGAARSLWTRALLDLKMDLKQELSADES